MLSVRRRLDLVRRTGTDAGISLTELLVTMALMSIVSALALTWLLGESKADARTQNSTYALNSARGVLQSWPALLRVADVPSNGYASNPSSTPAPTLTTIAPGSSGTGRFLAITSTSITFNADVANAPSATCGGTCLRGTTTQVTLALTGGALKQTLAQQGSATKSITFVPSGAALASGSSCLFTAYDVNGNSLGCTTTTSLAAIARVGLAFAVTPANGGTVQTYRSSTSISGTLAPVVAGTSTATTTAGA